MVLQSIVYPSNICKNSELYYRNAELLLLDEKTAMLTASNKVSFFSYMNCFDLDMWRKYTRIRNVILKLGVRGKGCLYLKCRNNCEDMDLSYLEFNTESALEYKELKLVVDIAMFNGLCYFEIVSERDVIINNARFETEFNYALQEVHLGLNICTYHRNTDIARNIEVLKNSGFFNEESELYKKLSIMIVDNGSELEEKEEDNYRLVHNINNGGSGGFKRGLQELRRWKREITHVVFMDDDVEFINESLYRLYALLSHIRNEYIHESVAGRMFRMDKRNMQYTAAEIWNKGDIKHIGFDQDVTKEENLLSVNANSCAEYGGWWFCSYPMTFAKDNDPLPFFIHCDDVEYGLRHGGTPIILNGIQVWHETYENRQNPIIVYYDMRNTLIVNQYHKREKNYDAILNEWRQKIGYAHGKKDYLSERMMIQAILDFLRGREWIEKINNYKYHKKISRIKGHRYVNAILWRITYMKFKLKYK